MASTLVKTSNTPANNPPPYLSEARIKDLAWDSAALAASIIGFTFFAPAGVLATGVYVLSAYGLVHNGLFLFLDVAVSDKDRAAIDPIKGYIGLVGRWTGFSLNIAGTDNQTAERYAYRAQAISDIVLGFRDFQTMGSGPSLFGASFASSQWMQKEVDWATSQPDGKEWGDYYIPGWREDFNVEPYGINDF